MVSKKMVLGPLVAFALGAACTAGGGGTEPGASTAGNGNGSASGGGGGGSGGSTSSGLTFPDTVGSSGSGDGGSTGSGSCAADSSKAELQPVYLGVAFDVSGSMGKLDKPYHDPKLKWEPVVAATKAFFTDPESKGISASLVFFPIDDSSDLRCDPNSYLKPDVPITELPSNVFGAAIDAITPKTSEEWRGGTPTLAVIDGTIGFLKPLVQADPNSKYAIVLISDGYPAGCDDDTIASVNQAVAGVASTIPTYVIGVANPPGGPDTVTNLNAIAAAGGTDKAFIVETGDPEKTKADFKAVIDEIRSKSISCEITIPPPPPGQVFDPTKVNVTYTSGASKTLVLYDEKCAAENTWHYDNPASPKTIVLCDSTCATVKADAAAALSVEFGCETVDVPE